MKKPKMIVHNEMVLTAKPGYEKAIEATNPLDRTARKVKKFCSDLSDVQIGFLMKKPKTIVRHEMEAGLRKGD